MNVTNRRKSTEADTPQSTQSIQQQQQQQQQPLLAYASCRQSATATTTTTRQEQLQNLQHRQHNVLEDNSNNNDDDDDGGDDQEQVVTSTSSDCLLPLAAEGEGEEVTLDLDNLVTSPARITSSTNNYEILTYNSDSLSREEMVMPSTSDSCRLDRERTKTTARGGHIAATTKTLNTTTLHHSITNSRTLHTNNEMVARDTTKSASVVETGGNSGGSSNLDLSASTSTSSSEGANENHKIILKLPKPAVAAPLESHGLNTCNEDDLRKVEPLKINLHNTHHHHHATHHTPKITIKPVVKDTTPITDIQMSSEECSSSAEDEIVSKLNASEPHIVPKLTIRAKNEELSTVVPKLTIKINDSNTGSTTEIHPAANTPPLPKLTIKTGQDGHSESIITNISPAFSTNSSSSSSCSSSSASTNLHVATNVASTTTTIPKLTIKPLQKSHETFSSSSSSSVADSEQQQQLTIPKLCIKGNMICNELPATSASEEATTSKIPKLTIKTGQEHAVIITQHNDNALVTGGIPKLTIKTKSLEAQDDSSNVQQLLNTEHSPNEKVPKITIKTNNMDSPNIVANKRSLLKSQMEVATPLSPKQAVPKLTITRQQNDMIVTQKHALNNEEECQNATIPKMTIKTQSKTTTAETVPKLTIKNIGSQQQRPSSTEESGLESDNEAEEEAVVKGSTLTQHCKTVPKLTIKNLGSPQQKLKVVQETKPEQSKANPAVMSVNSTEELVHVNLASPTDTDEFADLLNVDNGAGESSNSQEFCGFNDNTADSSAKVVVIATSDLTNIDDVETETRRNSDDMDIDEDLQTVHEPKIFQNDLHFQTQNPVTDANELLNGNLHHAKVAQIIDTVDLTSSPSRSCSPAQFDYNDDSNSVTDNTASNLTTNSSINPSTNILLERLQRETTVIQNTQQLKQQQQTLTQPQSQVQLQPQLQQQMNNDTTQPIPPPLQPKPNAAVQQSSPPASLKYPQLAERLMANGAIPNTSNNNNNLNSVSPNSLQSKQENIIDSIEILDTPEGSPRHSLDECPENFSKETFADKTSTTLPSNLPNGLHYPSNMDICAVNNNNSNLKRHALNTNMTEQINQLNHLEDENSINDLTVPPSKQRRLNNETANTKNSLLLVNNNSDLVSQQVLNSLEEINQTRVVAVSASVVAAQRKDFNCLKQSTSQTQHQRLRKQKHEHLLPVAMEEVVESAPTVLIEEETVTAASTTAAAENINMELAIANSTPLQKKRGRPRKYNITNSSTNSETANVNTTPQTVIPAQKDETDCKSRRVQLLRKRLAIDMVDADEPLRVLDELESVGASTSEETLTDSQERNLRTPLRTSRRSNTPTVFHTENKVKQQRPPSSLAMEKNIISTNKRSLLKTNNENAFNHFIESNSSLSSSAVSNSSVTLTSSTSIAAPLTQPLTDSFSMANQIDLTMSSSSSNSNSSTTNTVTTVEATMYSSKQSNILISNIMPPVLNLSSGQSTTVSCVGMSGGGSSNNSMLPPTTILSSSDPLPDVVFKHNDFSSILATQQLRTPIMSATDISLNESLDEDMVEDVSGPDNSGDDSASSSSQSTTPGRGRGRGRGSRGGRGRAYKAHRLGRNASAASKAIAMSRPRAVGALKHTPDPERMKPLYSPSPSVFEEDTRMSADLSQTVTQSTICEPPQTPTKQPDFLNNEESQSSILSNTSMLDPNNVAGLQNGPSAKKPAKRKKMEVCVAEDAELGVSAIAEYDWPRPKGCCPSKNRDTFMIQEQVALYLGIKSFKRKYPDLPRRQIDMEERNYLQEKNLVSEKMCDLGITAVWASDILDIMYTDFYDKYEEYKDFVRQKHLREIEAKQKSLGLNVTGRGLQARDRAMLSTSKWNAYFNKTRKEERLACLDLQTLTVNKPCPASAPIAAISYRPIAEAVTQAAEAEKIPLPPTLMKKRIWEPVRYRDAYYPLSLVPGQFGEKYYSYSAQELRQFPLNTMLEDASRTLPIREDTTDTDSAAETIDLTDVDKTAKLANRLSTQRRVRRKRAAKIGRKQNNDEFKVPPLPGATNYSSTETSSSSSNDSSSETGSDSSSSCSSSSENSDDDENSPANCAVCQQPQNCNLKNIPELFINCYTCRRKVHPSCIEMPHRMVNRVRNYNWQCADCKCCIKCKRKQYQNKMLYCEQCDRGFHIYCLSIKSVPDGRWSCERCSICMRCGATKPEGLPILQPNGEKLKVRYRKLKWINEYRIDHVTKLKEHCSMLCSPCGRPRTNKRVQINTHQNTNNTYITSPGSNCGSALSPIPSPNSTTTTPEMSPASTGNSTAIAATTAVTANLLTTAATVIATNNSNTNHTTSTQLTTTTTASYSTTATTTAKSLESKDSISLTANSLSLTDATAPQNIFTNSTTSIGSTITTTNIALPSPSSTATATNANPTLIATTTTTVTSSSTTSSGVAPPVVA